MSETDEVSALGKLAGTAVDRLAITPAQSLHRAIAGRVFGALGPLATPVRIPHDAIAGAVYGGLRQGARLGTRALAATVSGSGSATPGRRLSGSPGGRLAISAVNALLGDELAATGSDLAIKMAVREGGRDLDLTPAAVRAAFPETRSRIVVFLHGLGENEESWRRGGARHAGADRLPFGRRLEMEHGLSAVYVRYNSGLPVAENGRLLDHLLEDLVKAWPLPLKALSLVGHSMGGLVARAACGSAPPGREWLRHLCHLVTLGTPHTGAPLEKAVHALSWALSWVPEARPFGVILEHRSAGIRDLRRGLPAPVVPLPAGCSSTFITATVTEAPSHPLGWLAGDLLVRPDSARGGHRRGARPVSPPAVVELGPMNHFDLLDHPAVYRCLATALAG